MAPPSQSQISQALFIFAISISSSSKVLNLLSIKHIHQDQAAPCSETQKNFFLCCPATFSTIFSCLKHSLSLSSPKHCKPLIFLASVPFQSSLTGSFPPASFLTEFSSGFSQLSSLVILPISLIPHQICFFYVLPAQRLLSSSTQLYKPDT